MDPGLARGGVVVTSAAATSGAFSVLMNRRAFAAGVDRDVIVLVDGGAVLARGDGRVVVDRRRSLEIDPARDRHLVGDRIDRRRRLDVDEARGVDRQAAAARAGAPTRSPDPDRPACRCCGSPTSPARSVLPAPRPVASSRPDRRAGRWRQRTCRRCRRRRTDRCRPAPSQQPARAPAATATSGQAPPRCDLEGRKQPRMRARRVGRSKVTTSVSLIRMTSAGQCISTSSSTVTATRGPSATRDAAARRRERRESRCDHSRLSGCADAGCRARTGSGCPPRGRRSAARRAPDGTPHQARASAIERSMRALPPAADDVGAGAQAARRQPDAQHVRAAERDRDERRQHRGRRIAHVLPDAGADGHRHHRGARGAGGRSLRRQAGATGAASATARPGSPAPARPPRPPAARPRDPRRRPRTCMRCMVVVRHPVRDPDRDAIRSSDRGRARSRTPPPPTALARRSRPAP